MYVGTVLFLTQMFGPAASVITVVGLTKILGAPVRKMFIKMIIGDVLR